MKQWSITIKCKLIMGFSIIAVLVLLTGLVGYKSMTNVHQTSTVVEAALEMKLAVRGDLQVIMNLLTVDETEELNKVWKKHQQLVRDFDLFQNAILTGAVSDEITVYASTDQAIRKTIIKAKEIHRNSFLPQVQKLHNLRANEFKGDVPNEYSELLEEYKKFSLQYGGELSELLGSVEKQSKNAMRTTVSRASFSILLCVIIATLFSLATGLLLATRITNPLKNAMTMAGRLAEGDLTAKLEIISQDETGRLSQSLNNMADSLRGMFLLISNNSESLHSTSADLNNIAKDLTKLAETASSQADKTANASQELSHEMNSVAAASEEASVNITIVATATEEMTATVQEIANNSENAHAITEQAVSQSAGASTQVDRLGRAASEISKVTETITDISDQTNLLALNASIEAARAGEAGKGFAVVANEIKELAKQTAEATGEIREKIESIQSTAHITVDEIKQISDVINDVNDIVGTIATSVEEQASATGEISENVSQAAQVISEVNKTVAHSSIVADEMSLGIGEVSQAGAKVQMAGTELTVSAEDIGKLAAELQDLVARFRLE